MYNNCVDEAAMKAFGFRFVHFQVSGSFKGEDLTRRGKECDGRDFEAPKSTDSCTSSKVHHRYLFSARN